MTAHQLIKDFEVGQKLEQTFLLGDIESRTTAKGKPFGRLTLRDRSGQISVNVWDFNPDSYPELKSGVFISLGIEVQDYKGSKSAVSRSAPMVVPEPKDLSLYVNDKGLSDEQAEEYFNKLMEYKNEVTNPYLKAYLDVVFEHDAEMIDLLKTAPASTTNRGAYKGGLVEHVYKVMMNADFLIASQQEAVRPAPIDRDVVITSILMHDIGKVYAYKVDITGAKTTRSGRLLQHLPMSYGISVQAFIQAESMIRKPIPEELKDHINHCILAHHGVLEYGSPVKPQSVEAHIVHMADMADSSTSNFSEMAVDNGHQVDDDGFVAGNYFSSKRVFVGTENNDT